MKSTLLETRKPKPEAASRMIGVMGGVTLKSNVNIAEQHTKGIRNRALHLEAVATIAAGTITSQKFVCRKEEDPAKSRFMRCMRRTQVILVNLL